MVAFLVLPAPQQRSEKAFLSHHLKGRNSIDMTQLAELARLTRAVRFRRAVLTARNLAPFMAQVAARSKAERDELPG